MKDEAVKQWIHEKNAEFIASRKEQFADKIIAAHQESETQEQFLQRVDQIFNEETNQLMLNAAHVAREAVEKFPVSLSDFLDFEAVNPYASRP